MNCISNAYGACIWLQKQATGYVDLKFQMDVRASDTHVEILSIEVVVTKVSKDEFIQRGLE